MVIIILVSLLNFIVHLTGTLAYSTRLAGVLSKRLSLSISLSNILSIVSRSASVVIIPMLSQSIERDLSSGVGQPVIPSNYFAILGFGILGSVAGILFLERFVVLLYYTVNSYTTGDNTALLFIRQVFNRQKREELNLTIEKSTSFSIEWRYLFLNMLITLVYTSATLAAIYSAYLVPQYRVTSLSLSFIINGLATLAFVTIIDPYVSDFTDDAMAGKESFPKFYYRIRRFVVARFMGVLLSLLTFRLFVTVLVNCIGFVS